MRQTIPDDLLTPCRISARKVQTVKELAILATEHLNSAVCANGKIEGIAEIVGRDESQAKLKGSETWAP